MHRVISAKTGLNIDQVLEQIVTKIPAPTGDPEAPLQALIFDALYDCLQGCYRILPYQRGNGTSGRYHPHDGNRCTVRGQWRSDILVPDSLSRVMSLAAGMVGYLTVQVSKMSSDTRVGDTDYRCRPIHAASRFRVTKRSIRWCTAVLYPADGAKYPDLRDALEKLQIERCVLAV